MRELSEAGNPKTIESILHYGEGKPTDNINVNLSHDDALSALNLEAELLRPGPKQK